MKIAILLPTLFLIVSSIFSQKLTKQQQDKIDSLVKIISTKTNYDTTLAQANLELGEILYLNVDTLQYYCEKAVSICLSALKNKNEASHRKRLLTIYCSANHNIGYCYYMRADYNTALSYYKKEKPYLDKYNLEAGLSSYYSSVGSVYGAIGDVPKAIDYYSKGLKIDEKIGDKKSIANSLNNIGYIHDNQGQKDLALKYHFKSLKIKQEIGDQYGIAFSYINIGALYKAKGEINKAFDYIQKSKDIRTKIGDKNGVASCLNNLGYLYVIQEDYTKAHEDFQNALTKYEEIKDKKGIAESLRNIADIHLKTGDLTKAEHYASRSYELIQEVGFPYLTQYIANLLSTIYEKQGKKKQALELYKVAINMRDSIKNESTLKESSQQQAKYEYEKQKAIDDALHEKEIAIKQEEKEKQKILTYTTGGGLGLVGIFLLIVFNRLKVTRKQKNIIEHQKNQVEQQKQAVEETHKQLEEKNQEILDSIIYAKRIQSAILPPAKVVKEYLQDSFIFYRPKDIVAGDFYWMESIGNKTLFAAADCTGHGVPGAMVSVVCNNGLNRSVREFGLTDPGKILDKTRELVVQEFEKSEEDVKDGMDIALCCLQDNILEYSGAHNPLWIIRKGAQEIEEIKADKQPVGKFDNIKPYTTHRIKLNKGDSFYIFSDGFQDQFGGEKGKKFKTVNFKKLLISFQGESMEKQLAMINDCFEKWKGNIEQLDDVCVFGVTI